jgi:phospholipase C
VAGDGARAYDLALYGPNGFLRVWRGDLRGTGPAPAGPFEVSASADPAGGALVVQLRNLGGAGIAVMLLANAYHQGAADIHLIPAGAAASVRWSVAESAGWYDITVSGADGFRILRRLAGHVEGGAATTDPAMGALIAAAPFDGPQHRAATP